MISLELSASVATLLDSIGEPPKFEEIQITGGRNNRVHKISVDGKSYCLKRYVPQKVSGVDRLQAEFSFLEYAWGKGIRVIPKPLAKDEKARIALYSFVSGTRLLSDAVEKNHVVQAAEFIKALQAQGNSEEAFELPNASGACFSIQKQLELVEERVNRLAEIVAVSGITRAAARFHKNCLELEWNKVRKIALSETLACELKKNKELSLRDRCISPSDFGYHNALRNSEGHMLFLDFEYAGWDDPAKLICDFFLQPEISVPKHYASLFCTAIRSLWAEDRSSSKALLHRARILFPVFQIKWCCILMNEFLHDDAVRRRFAHGEMDLNNGYEIKRQEEQLLKAQSMLAQRSDVPF